MTTFIAIEEFLSANAHTRVSDTISRAAAQV